MGTFSVNNGQITEAISYPLHIQSNFDDILLTLQDNVEKLIDPKDIRDALLSLWSSVPFKETIGVNLTGTKDEVYTYIGLDATDPSDRDIKKKILIGKRSYSGTYSYVNSHDIMTPQLLNSDVDIFLFNTKPDTISNTTTRISILSGKNTGLYTIAPFIQSQYVSGTNNSLSMDFVSRVGDVNFNLNELTTGTFSLNNIQLPPRIESEAGIESKTLVWRGPTSTGRVYWEELTRPILSTIGTSSEPLIINGSPVNVNGYSLELNTTDYTPRSFGGIPMGTTFNNVAISEVLRRILYPYLGPLCTISTLRNYEELGSSPDTIINYTVIKRTEPTLPASLSNTTSAIIPAITGQDYITISGTSAAVFVNSELGEDPVIFTISVSDGTTSTSASTFVQGILPYFYGVSSNGTSTILTTLALTKLVETQGDKELYLNGLAGQYLYFIYDASYPNLSQILDGNNLNVILSFELSTVLFTSPQNYWANKNFKVYKLLIITPIGPPNVKYQFRY
jgi:hypothetical protein